VSRDGIYASILSYKAHLRGLETCSEAHNECNQCPCMVECLELWDSHCGSRRLKVEGRQKCGWILCSGDGDSVDE